MAAIRVTIGDMPPLLRSLVRGMLDEDPQFEITSQGAFGTGPETAPHSDLLADVLVISEEAMTRVVPLSTLRSARGELGVVAIAPDGLDAAVVHLSAHRRRLDGEPRQTLSEAIVDAAGALSSSGPG